MYGYYLWIEDQFAFSLQQSSGPFPFALSDLPVFTQLAAAKAWTTWEMMTAHLIPSEENIKRGDDDDDDDDFSLVSL